MFDYDLFVIGGGSGGVRAARVAAGLGARAAIAEERYWGGTCVNVGCVPKKLFAYAARFAEDFGDAARFGWTAGEPAFDWPTLRDNKTAEIERLNGVYDRMLRAAGVELAWGRASVVDPHTVEIGGERRTAAHILVAVGGWPHVPDIPGKHLAITSNEAFFLESLPGEIVIVGGGYVAIEFAGIFNGLGAKTTQLYRGPLFLRGFDDDIRAHMAREMRKKGVDLRFDSDVRAIGEENGRLVAALADGGRIEADAIMYATGRRPLTRGIGLEEAGVVLNDDGTVPVDERFRSSAPSILALGDAVGRFELTPVAIAEGMAIAEMLFGDRAAAVDYANVPSAVFGQPPIGTVGLTEAQARDARGDDVEVYVSEFRPLKHTISLNGERTLMKIVAAPGGGPVLGVHMAGPDAGETIQGFAVALKAGATKAVFDSTLGVHPTGAEEFVTMREAVSAGAREAAQ